MTAKASQSMGSARSRPPSTFMAKGRIQSALELAKMEQEVEDYNAGIVASARDQVEAASRRRLICMPLDERFDPSMGQFSHKHVQTGDKMSLPRNFWDAIMKSGAEVPWLFEVSRIDGVTKPRVENVGEEYAMNPLDKVVGGILDTRAPSNYIFLPWWMMRALGLHPRDIVNVQMITTVPPGSSAKFRPHSTDFANNIDNPQAVMETELKHYSSLTKGASIAMDYNGQRYWLDIVDIKSSPRNERVSWIKVQDCNVSTDFLTAKNDKSQKRKRKEVNDETN